MEPPRIPCFPPTTALPRDRRPPRIVDRDEPAAVRLTAEDVAARPVHHGGLAVGSGPLERPPHAAKCEVAGDDPRLLLRLQRGLHRQEGSQRLADPGDACDLL